MSRIIAIVALAALAVVAQAAIEPELVKVLNQFDKKLDSFIGTLVEQLMENLGHSGEVMKPGNKVFIAELSSGHHAEIAESIYQTVAAEGGNDDILEPLEAKKNEVTGKVEPSKEACDQAVEVAMQACQSYVDALSTVVTPETNQQPKRAFIVLDTCKGLLANDKSAIAQALFDYKTPSEE